MVASPATVMARSPWGGAEDDGELQVLALNEPVAAQKANEWPPSALVPEGPVVDALVRGHVSQSSGRPAKSGRSKAAV